MRTIKWQSFYQYDLTKLSLSRLNEIYDNNLAWIEQQAKLQKISAHTEEKYIDDLYPIQLELQNRSVKKLQNKEIPMARRSLSTKQIKDGMAYIHSLLVDKKISARDIVKDPNLPFSMTTYYKYLAKYEKSLDRNKVDIFSDSNNKPQPKVVTPPNNTKKDDLVSQNQLLLDEINLLTRFIVKKFVAKELGEFSENNSSNLGVH